MLTVLCSMTGFVSPTARATADDVALNGDFTAISDGQYAKTNERFHDEATVAATWTITSTCESYLDCQGTVTSTLGWSADIAYQSNVWKIVRQIDDWERCADGTSAPGQQIYMFWNDGDNPGRLTGWDTTTGPSGACNINRTLVIELPLTVTPT